MNMIKIDPKTGLYQASGWRHWIMCRVWNVQDGRWGEMLGAVFFFFLAMWVAYNWHHVLYRLYGLGMQYLFVTVVAGICLLAIGIIYGLGTLCLRSIRWLKKTVSVWGGPLATIAGVWVFCGLLLVILR